MNTVLNNWMKDTQSDGEARCVLSVIPWAFCLHVYICCTREFREAEPDGRVYIHTYYNAMYIYYMHVLRYCDFHVEMQHKLHQADVHIKIP